MPSAPESQVTVFARLLGRQPSEAEVARLMRVKDALGIADNDALWVVILALENYDVALRRYPALLSAETDRVLANVRQSIESMARMEAQRAQHTLAEAVAATAQRIADARATRSLWLMLGWAVVGATLLAGLCLTAGFVLASGQAPFWAAAPQPGGSALLGLLHLVLAAPVGWVAVAATGVCVSVAWWRGMGHRPSWTQVAGMSGLLLMALGTIATLL